MNDPLHQRGESESAQPASPASAEPPTIFSVPTPPPAEPPPPPPPVESYQTPQYPPYEPGYATPPGPVPSGPPAPPPYPTSYPPVSSAPYPPPPAAGYPAAYVAAPMYDPVTGEPLSDKSKLTAGLLQLLLGFFFVLGGVGRLYAGNTTVGVIQIVCSVVAWISFWCGVFLTAFIVGLLFFPITFGMWVWFIVDGVMMLAGRPRDGQGRLLRA